LFSCRRAKFFQLRADHWESFKVENRKVGDKSEWFAWWYFIPCSYFPFLPPATSTWINSNGQFWENFVACGRKGRGGLHVVPMSSRQHSDNLWKTNRKSRWEELFCWIIHKYATHFHLVLGSVKNSGTTDDRPGKMLGQICRTRILRRWAWHWTSFAVEKDEWHFRGTSWSCVICKSDGNPIVRLCYNVISVWFYIILIILPALLIILPFFCWSYPETKQFFLLFLYFSLFRAHIHFYSPQPFYGFALSN